MPKIAYLEKKFQRMSEELIQIADKICMEYAQKGFDLTLRQLYYQFVARDIIPNSERSYKNLGSLLNNARLAGLLDWDHVVDRTRNLYGNSHWNQPSDIIDSCASRFQIDKWDGQSTRVEVWIEKEALAGVVQQICSRLDVPFFPCKGYVSQSEMWRAAQRINRYKAEKVVIIHLGDHDPSGIDMTRDIDDRLFLFESDVKVNRVALNMDQIKTHNPPPNPAKVTDSRAKGYVSKYGRSSWELDALDPETLQEIIRINVDQNRDIELFEEKRKQEEKHVELLQKTANRWSAVVTFLNE